FALNHLIIAGAFNLDTLQYTTLGVDIFVLLNKQENSGGEDRWRGSCKKETLSSTADCVVRQTKPNDE
ncbi:MAG: hypothetical protein WCF38_09880, partial [Pseudolabrys sp.]